MEQLTQSYARSEDLTTLADVNLSSSTYSESYLNDKLYEIAKIVTLSTFPIILVMGTLGNLLTFIVMQRGTLKHSSTCFFMAMLAVADTCKCFLIFLPIHILKEIYNHQKTKYVILISCFTPQESINLKLQFSRFLWIFSMPVCYITMGIGYCNDTSYYLKLKTFTPILDTSQYHISYKI